MNAEFDELDFWEDNDSLVKLTVKHKIRDDFSEDNKYYPLLSNISDVEGVIAEHSELNKNENWLQFALFKDNDKYYFFDVRKNSTELKLYVDDNKFICPYCQSSLIAVSSHIRKGTRILAHLRHSNSANEVVKNCIFNTSNKRCIEYRNDFYSGESYRHKKLKMRIYKLAKSKKLKIFIPDEYEIIENLKSYETKVEFTRKEVTIVDALLEQRVLKKNEETKGYQPDIVLITDTGEHIYCEITVLNGKTVNDYHDIWNKLNKPVLEIKYSENEIINDVFNILDTFNNLNYIDETEELFLFNDATVRFLYSPVIDKARKEYHISRLKIAENFKKDEEIKELKKLETARYNNAKKDLWLTIMRMIEWYRDKTKFKVYYNSLFMKWTDELGKDLPLEWNNIEYNGFILNLKLPTVVWNMLSVNKVKFNKGYKNVNYLK